MRFIKSKYELTLNEVSLLFETGKLSILKRSKYVPSFILKRGFEKFSVEFAEMFNREQVNQLIEDDIIKLKIINEVNNILMPLYMGLLISENPGFRKVYEAKFGRPYQKTEDLKIIIMEIDRLKHKITEFSHPEKKVKDAKKLFFEEVITYVETLMERNIDREMKLYQFKFQYDLAVKRAAEMEKMRK